MAVPKIDEIRRLLHALREPVSAFSIYLSLLDNGDLGASRRPHLDAMHANVEHMSKALAEITSAFGLEVGGSTPLAVLSEDRSSNRVRR